MTDKELFELCKKYGSNALMWRRKFESLLPEVARRELYRKHDCHSIFEFAAKYGGVSNRITEEVLRTHRLLKNKPKIKAKMVEVGWSKSRVIVPLIEKVKEEEIVEMMDLPIRPLKEVVKGLVGTDVCVPEKRKMNFEIDEETELEFKKFQLKLEKEKNRKFAYNEVLKELLKNVNKPAPTRTQSVPRTKPTKTLTPARKREKLKETNGRCSRCKAPATQFHHPDRQSLKQGHENILPLCKTCHQLAHSGRIVNENDHASQWRIRPSPDKTTTKYKIDLKVQRHWRPQLLPK